MTIFNKNSYDIEQIKFHSSVIKITRSCKNCNFIVTMEINVQCYNNKDRRLQFQAGQFHFACFSQMRNRREEFQAG